MRMGHVESELRTVIWPVPQRHCVRESSESPWRGHDRQQHACMGVLLQREKRCLDAECGSTVAEAQISTTVALMTHVTAVRIEAEIAHAPYLFAAHDDMLDSSTATASSYVFTV